MTLSISRLIEVGMITVWPLYKIPFSVVISSRNDQYWLINFAQSRLLCGHPFKTTDFKTCNVSSTAVQVSIWL